MKPRDRHHQPLSAVAEVPALRIHLGIAVCVRDLRQCLTVPALVHRIDLEYLIWGYIVGDIAHGVLRTGMARYGENKKLRKPVIRSYCWKSGGGADAQPMQGP